MAKNPDERYGSVGELLEAAEAALSGAGRAAETRPAALVRPDGSAVSPPPGTAETAPSAAALAGTATSTAPAAPTAPAGSTKSTREAGSTSARVPARPVGAPAGRRARILGLAAAAAVILGTAAYLLGASGGEEARAAPASAGPLRMELPPNWRRTPTIPSIPGLSLRDAANFAPAGGEQGSLLAGTSDAEGPTLLPDGFERRLGEAPDREDVVEVGDVQAYRYRNLTMRGLGLPATVFVAPLPNRVATIVCLGAAEADTTRECEGAASTLELVDTDALPLGARDDYARPLNRLLGRLDTRRRSGRRELREAETPGAQAAAATGIANAYGDAERAARRLPAGPAERPATRGLATSLDSAGAAYRGLAAAARSGDAAAYASGLDAVRARERALSQALDELGRLGYRVR